MLPLKSEKPTRKIPFISVGIISLNLIVFIYQRSLGSQLNDVIFAFGTIPYEIFNNVDLQPTINMPVQWTLITYMFMHGGILHIANNMLYLWVFGNNIEDAIGHTKFIFFYLICGVIAALVHIYTHADSQSPMVGASGAISGILGAYVLLYPGTRVLTLVIIGIFVKMIKIRAFYVIGFWIILQFANSLFYPNSSNANNTAWYAHIGGFFAGMILVRLFTMPWFGKGKEKISNSFYRD